MNILETLSLALKVNSYIRCNDPPETKNITFLDISSVVRSYGRKSKMCQLSYYLNNIDQIITRQFTSISHSLIAG